MKLKIKKSGQPVSYDDLNDKEKNTVNKLKYLLWGWCVFLITGTIVVSYLMIKAICSFFIN